MHIWVPFSVSVSLKLFILIFIVNWTFLGAFWLLFVQDSYDEPPGLVVCFTNLLRLKHGFHPGFHRQNPNNQCQVTRSSLIHCHEIARQSCKVADMCYTVGDTQPGYLT